MTDDDSLVGQRIGVYELQALIGAGGMGRVYPRGGSSLKIWGSSERSITVMVVGLGASS
jgi:hypothetical protein